MDFPVFSGVNEAYNTLKAELGVIGLPVFWSILRFSDHGASTAAELSGRACQWKPAHNGHHSGRPGLPCR